MTVRGQDDDTCNRSLVFRSAARLHPRTAVVLGDELLSADPHIPRCGTLELAAWGPAPYPWTRSVEVRAARGEAPEPPRERVPGFGRRMGLDELAASSPRFVPAGQET
jgi:hypothetical protein